MKVSDILLISDLIESNPGLLKAMRIFNRIDQDVRLVECDFRPGWNFVFGSDEKMTDSDFDDLHDLGCVFVRNNKVGNVVWFFEKK